MNALLNFPLATNSPRILRRLREILGGAAITPEEKLNSIVKIIANEMAVDVCSIYILRAGVVLELFATYGLNPQAIHQTRLKFGQGIVGDVAQNFRPLVLSDVQSYQNFHFVEGIGEENLHSFAGVPISRGGNVLGVLAIQSYVKRLYFNEEVEILQTIAMILAEIIASGEIISKNEILPSEGVESLSIHLKGISLNPGLVIGQAVSHHPGVMIKRLISDDVGEERKRFNKAVRSMQASLKNLIGESMLIALGEEKSILEAYQMFAQDYGWLKSIRKSIDTGLSAEAAVQQFQANLRQELRKSPDSYFKERLLDFEDLTNRLLHHLVGDKEYGHLEGRQGIVVIARNLGPAELLEYEKYNVQGLILEEGLDTAHVSIIARALNIPVVSRVSRISLRVEPGDQVIVDGDKGQVILNPNDEDVVAFEKNIQTRRRRFQIIEKNLNMSSVTKDGQRISLHLNVGLQGDLKYISYDAIDGIGLYRTEIPFMMAETYPDVATQTRIYGDILAAAKDKPVYFRTLDIGGDKILPYLREPEDENPMMGWRAIRIGLDRPILLRQQLRALIKAASGKNLNVMFPMIADIKELIEARKILDLELKNAEKNNFLLPASLHVGVMLEVPSLVWRLDHLLSEVDFISLGSNDLFQFFYAADRNNHHLINRFDPLMLSFVELLQYIIKRVKRSNKSITVCGEMASQPIEALALLALGFRSLSVTSSSMPAIQKMIQDIELKKVSHFVQNLIKIKREDFRNNLISYAIDHNISI